MHTRTVVTESDNDRVQDTGFRVVGDVLRVRVTVEDEEEEKESSAVRTLANENKNRQAWGREDTAMADMNIRFITSCTGYIHCSVLTPRAKFICRRDPIRHDGCGEANTERRERRDEIVDEIKLST